MHPAGQVGDVGAADLVRHGFIAAKTDLVGTRRGHPTRRAVLEDDGSIRTESGQAFNAPTPAAEDVLDVRSANGWTYWRVRRTNETLDMIRSRYELWKVESEAHGT